MEGKESKNYSDARARAKEHRLLDHFDQKTSAGEFRTQKIVEGSQGRRESLRPSSYNSIRLKSGRRCRGFVEASGGKVEN